MDDILIPWSSAVNGLSIGIRLRSISPAEPLFVFLKNVGSTPKDLFVATGEVQRISFTATAPDGKQCAMWDLSPRPCGGLCNTPVTERLDAGESHRFTFVLQKLWSIPPKGPDANLFTLLDRGYSVQAAFEMTGQQLKETGLELKDPWLGRVVSNAVRRPIANRPAA